MLGYVSQAKNMHGTKFDDSIMIAVQPCTDIDFIGSNTNTVRAIKQLGVRLHAQLLRDE